MIKGIADAQVFDPALTSLEDEAIPARIELDILPNLNTETITYENEGPDWTVYHYGRLMKIEPFDLHEDWEVADFNASGMLPEAVVPVTLVIPTQSGPLLEDYWVKFTDARQIVDYINVREQLASGGQYILVPNEAWAKENKVAFRLQHTRHTCIRCFREKYGSNPVGTLEHLAVPVGKPVEVAPKRMVDLCENHIRQQRAEAGARRLSHNH